MTKHYSAHATLEDKRKNMLRMAGFLQLPEAVPAVTEPERAELHRLAGTLPIEKIRKILAMDL